MSRPFSFCSLFLLLLTAMVACSKSQTQTTHTFSPPVWGKTFVDSSRVDSVELWSDIGSSYPQSFIDIKLKGKDAQVIGRYFISDVSPGTPRGRLGYANGFVTIHYTDGHTPTRIAFSYSSRGQTGIFESDHVLYSGGSIHHEFGHFLSRLKKQHPYAVIRNPPNRFPWQRRDP